MAIHARILTPVEFPEEVDVELHDTIRGEKKVVKVNFRQCLDDLAKLGVVDLSAIDPAELFSMACALAKHRAIDSYLMSIGIDPHKETKPLEEE